jgi:hypothetical protein
MGGWVPHDVRDEVVDFVTYWSERGELEARRIVGWVGVGLSKYYSWKRRYGKVNEHNASIPRDHWITDAERRAILDFEEKNPAEGYRRLTFMMNDANAVAVAPSTVYRVLLKAGRIAKWAPPPTRKGQGFAQPGSPHRDWHIDVASTICECAVRLDLLQLYCNVIVVGRKFVSPKI